MSDLRRPGEGLASVLEVIDVVLGELDVGEFEELRPTDTIDPLAHPLVLLGVLGVDVDDLGNRFDHLGPTRRVVGDEGNGELRELRRDARVRNLTADPDGDTVGLGVVDFTAGQTV